MVSRSFLLLHVAFVFVLVLRDFFSWTVSILLLLPFFAYVYLGETTQLFRLVMDKFPGIRRWFWRKWYAYCKKAYEKSDVVFMNYGYHRDGFELPLSDKDEPMRFGIQLYHHTASGNGPLTGKDVLEIGCGRGGGARYVMSNLRPRRMVGVDFAAENIELASTHSVISGLSFKQGDAEALPEDMESSFDAVLNVESSHCYGNIDKFLSEVYRVLRPGGVLLFTDLRGNEKFRELQESIAHSGLTISDFEDVTLNVVASLERESRKKERFIQENVPWWLHFVAREFMAVEGSKVFNSFRNGSLRYVRYVLMKPEVPADHPSVSSSSSAEKCPFHKSD